MLGRSSRGSIMCRRGCAKTLPAIARHLCPCDYLGTRLTLAGVSQQDKMLKLANFAKFTEITDYAIRAKPKE
ncbi:hypothetical protein NDU88_005722 [Pleurodeles waltl]|uniref:Uncharacterized protein n=1 Tax=Pleurodeles waltl TaxID=8319 RepID=A0AAV7VJT3_PLEWA|nr:hypothetical protein NDU88_005722 [Pleurodeles waltl]